MCSTIGAKELNFRVRDGNGCTLFAIATENRGKNNNNHIYAIFRLSYINKIWVSLTTD